MWLYKDDIYRPQQPTRCDENDDIIFSVYQASYAGEEVFLSFLLSLLGCVCSLYCIYSFGEFEMSCVGEIFSGDLFLGFIGFTAYTMPP